MRLRFTNIPQQFHASFARPLQNPLMKHIFTPPNHSNRRQALVTALGFAATPMVFAQLPIYIDETWQDPRRQRAVPVRIRWPQGAAPLDGWPVVIYSHGLGGSRAGGDVC